MKIGPLFKWFGSKWQSAKRYPSPMHDTIIEPFCGGAGYSLNWCDRQVVIFDADPNLSKLWPWLIEEATSDLVLQIPIDVPEGTDIRTLGLTDGQALLMKHWQRTNNVGDCWTVSPWGNKPGQWTRNTRSRVSEQVHAVKHWSFADPYSHIDDACTWFIDPPYQFNYRYRSGIGLFDYQNLDSLTQTISPQSLIIVCEAVGKNGETPDYLPFVASHSSVTSRRKVTQSHHSKELIYVRRPS